MHITFSVDKKPDTEQVIELYNNAGLPRLTHDKERIQNMFDNSNLIVTAGHHELLVGVSRFITDWVWSYYLADLAVRKEFQKGGFGKRLI